ncbi:uncharacterized protein LOC110933922 [Helianthus annuus]|uniref:uncharacterized protein LOC110933922 n=1 Tax=Helianthus annuus TaxID=4232 RepID=UPI000B908635|nr:uncharacterized protein LOC110933922 [Helianthus annuus]
MGLQSLDQEKLKRLLNKVKEAESGGVSKSLKNSVLSKNSSLKKRLEESFAMLERNEVDLKIIRGLCANGIPFNVLRNPQFTEMVSAIKKAPDGYKPPSSEKARTTLLDSCVRDVEKELTPVKDTWYTQGVSIVSDGWTNVKHNPLINVLAVNSRGAMFMHAGDFLGVDKKAGVIAKYLIEAIETVGSSNVLQVVTDNAANCKKAGQEIEKVAKTRFVSHYILLRRLLDCREALATTIVLNSWWDWMKSGDEKARTDGANITETIKDEGFWESVENILAITKPIFLLIKFCDGEGLKMGEIYEKMYNMVGEIKDVMKDNKYVGYFEEINQIVLARWDKMSIPLHCLGHALNPRFYDKHFLQKLAPGDVKRKAPNLDVEVANGVIEVLKKSGKMKRNKVCCGHNLQRFI